MKNKPVILVVDDQLQNIELLEAHLVTQGYEIIPAESGEEALEKLSGNQVDLILLDVVLPGMSGFEVLAKLRSDTKTVRIPVIMITAHKENEDTVKALESGCDDYISQPFDKHELLARVKSLLRIKFLNDEADEASAFAESIIDTVREPLIALDQDLRVVAASRSFYVVFKVTPKETVGQLIYDLGNKQWDIPKLRELLETVLPEKTTFDNYEVEHNFATIGRRIMLLNARQIKRAFGKERIILLAIEDITERKRLEDLLTESELQYRRLFETASDGIVLLEKSEGHIIHANPAAGKMLGYAEEEYIGKKLQDIGISLDMSDFPAVMQDLKKSGILNYEDVPIKTKSGQYIDTDIYMVDRAKLAQCNIRDVTERRKTMETLRLHSEIMKNMAEGVYLVQVDDGTIVYTNPKFEMMFGYDPDELLGKNAEIVIAPSDKTPKEILKTILESLVKTGEWHGDVENIRKDGTRFWCYVNVSLLDHPEFGRVMVSVRTDITERKRSEKDLMERERELSLMAESMPQIVWITRPDGWNIYFNQQWMDYTGQTLEESYGYGWNKPFHPVDQQRAWDAWQNATKYGGAYSLECRLRRADGVYKWWLIRGVPVRDEHGTVLKWFGTCTDIDDIKQTEESLRSLTLRHEAILAAVPDIIMEVDNNKVYTWANKAGYEFFGDDVIGKEAASYFEEEQQTYNMVQPLFEGSDEVIYVESRQMRKDGAKRLLAWWCRILKNSEGKVTGVLSSARDITKYKKAEEAVANVARFPEENPSPVMRFSFDGAILYANSASSPLKKLWSVELGQKAPAGIASSVMEVCSSGVSKKVEVVCGDTIFSLNMAYIKNASYINVYGRDITEEKHAQETIKEERKQFENALRKFNEELMEKVKERTSELEKANTELRKLFNAIEQSEESIVITDVNGTIEYVNPAFTKKTGYSKEEAIANNPKILQSGLTPIELYNELWQTILSGNPWRGILINKKKSGEIYYENATIAPVLDEHGKITHFVAAKTDITDRIMAEEELKRKNIELELATETADDANRAKSEFLANMSHELRTPLNSIIGFSELLEDGIAGPIADNQKELVNDISTSGKYLLSLINDILDLAKVEAGKMELEFGEFNLEELIDGSLAMFREKAMKNNIKIATEVEKGIGEIEADERKIKQILFNLLSNAFKFTPDGGSVRVAARKIGSSEVRKDEASETSALPRFSTDGDFVEISVTDTGIGVSPEDQKKLFQSFQQIDSVLSRKYAGTGLGLNLCKQFIELHGGRLWVESEVDKGSRFVFVIPLKQTIDNRP